MAAIMRVVDGVGGGMVLDLNAKLGGGILNARGDKVLAQTALTDDQVGDAKTWWSPATSPAEVASRRVSIPLTVQGTSQDDVAARVRALTQAVAVPWVLEVRRHGASASGFLRCQPCAPQVSAVVNAVGTSLTADVLLTAETEPYALGAQVDTGNLTFTQDTSVSTALYADVTGVQGDAPTPAMIRWNLAGLGINTHGAFWSIRRTSDRRDDPTALTGIVAAGNGFTSSAVSGANVTVSTIAADTDFSGNTAGRVNFGAGATITDFGTMTYTFGLTGPQAPGTYRLIARGRRAGGSAGVQHTIRVGLGAYIPQDYLHTAGGTDLRVLDLGLVQVPSGSSPLISAPIAGDRSASPPLVSLTIFKSGAAGSGQYAVDWLALIPADEDAGWWRIQQSASTWAFLDGYSGDAGFSSADIVTSTSAVIQSMASGVGSLFTGRVPRLGPGTNRLYVVQGLTGSVLWPKTASVTAKIAYWPRYRWLP